MWLDGPDGQAQKVTLNFRNAKLEQVFERITEQTATRSLCASDGQSRQDRQHRRRGCRRACGAETVVPTDKVEIEIRDGKIYPSRQSAAAAPQSVKGVVRDAAGLCPSGPR